MVQEALLRHLPVREEQVFRMHGEIPDAAEAAARYEDVIRRAFNLEEQRRGPRHPDEMSLLLVEQYVSKALDLADYVYIMNKGRISFVGEPSEKIFTTLSPGS